VRSKKLPENWQELQEKIKNVFVFLETELQKRGSLFFNGQTLPGMLDYMMWPWMERLEVPSAIHADLNSLLGVPTSDFPLMVNTKNSLNSIHFHCFGDREMKKYKDIVMLSMCYLVNKLQLQFPFLLPESKVRSF
jgi:hypothetical protein